MKKIIIIIFALFLAGCTAGLNQVDIRHRLDYIETDFSVSFSRLKEFHRQGRIDPKTWADIVELNDKFSDVWSMAVVELNAGEDLKQSISSLAEIMTLVAGKKIDLATADKLRGTIKMVLELRKRKR